MKTLKLLTITLLIVSLISPGTLFAQEGSSSYSLEQAKDFAIKNSITIKNANLDVDLAKAEIRKAGVAGLPGVRASLGYQNFIDIPTQVVPANAFDPSAQDDLLIPLKFGTDHNVFAKVYVNQLIFSASYFVGLQASRVYKGLSESNLRRTELDIKDMVSQSYYTALVAMENKKIITQSLENLKKILAESKVLNENGFIEELEYEQLMLTVTEMENMSNTAEGRVQMTLNMLKFQMGVDVGSAIILSDGLESILGEVDNELTGTPALDLNGHVNYRIILTQQKLQELSLRNERLSLLPTVTGFFTHSQNGFANEIKFDPYYPTTIWGINLTVPIRWTSPNSKKAKLELQKIQNSKIELEQGLKMEVMSTSISYDNARAQYFSEKQNIDLAKKILDKTLIKYREGMVSSMEVTQANNQYLSTQGKYFNSIFELLSTKNRLDKALNNN
ncbi:MAG: TolC family protein [Bacteroidetes bacterium]|nr:TolC family protein [Bacteroidota bacterium]